MNHLFLAESDFAASGFCFVQALRAVGEIADEYVGRLHQYQYARQGTLFPDDIKEFCARLDQADFVWVVQSDLPIRMGGWWGHRYTPERAAALREWTQILARKRVVLLHGGGLYRDNREFFAQMWRGFNPVSICYEADLMGSFEREHLILPPVNTDDFAVTEPEPGRLRIGHFPSRPTEKGSAEILPALYGIRGIDVRTSVTDPNSETGCERVSNYEQLQRMAQCDIIVDQICPTLNGKPFGEWVSLSLEAAALGRIVITNSQNPSAYVREYGCRPALKICNTVEDMVRVIEEFKTMPRPFIRYHQMQTRRWVEDVHGLVPSGLKLLDILGLREGREVA